MFKTVYRDSKYLLGRYQFLDDPVHKADIIDRIPKLQIHRVSNYNGTNSILAPVYGNCQVILYLTTYSGIPVGFLYIPKSDEIAVVNLRFHSKFYENSTVIYGELINKCDTTYLCVEAVRLNDESQQQQQQRVCETITQFDQILYTSFKEDLDLEPLRIIIKPYYENKTDIPAGQDIMFLNTNLDSVHYIETK